MAKAKDLGAADPGSDHIRFVVGPALGRAREAAGITQPDAAKALGVHYMTLSEWERGKARVPAEALLTLLPLYGVAFEDLSPNGGRTGQPSQKVARGTPSRLSEPRSPPYAGISFNSPIEAQRSRVWLEGFLLELAESGADVDFLRRLEAGVRAILAEVEKPPRGVSQGRGTPVPRPPESA